MNFLICIKNTAVRHLIMSNITVEEYTQILYEINNQNLQCLLKMKYFWLHFSCEHDKKNHRYLEYPK